jgi:D-lyxose ketol-isomerase
MRSIRAVAVLSLLSAAVLAGCADKQAIHFDNSYFYDAGGKFQPDKAKDAYVALMKYHGYPVFPGIREKMWVSDYGTGQFASLGLGAVMFKNNEEHRYMLMDIYLLPNQMLPEHWHEATDKNPAKLEGWLVRHGLSHVVGEGEANLSPEIKIPKCHMNGTATVHHEVICRPGDFAPLNRAKARHWQYAGPEGAIITEVANAHTDSAVRHSDKAINDNFLGK